MDKPEKAFPIRKTKYSVSDLFSKQKHFASHTMLFSIKIQANPVKHFQKTLLNTNRGKCTQATNPTQLCTSRKIKKLIPCSSNPKIPTMHSGQQSLAYKVNIPKNPRLINDVYTSASKANIIERPKVYSKVDDTTIHSIQNNNNRNFQNSMTYSRTIEAQLLQTQQSLPNINEEWEYKCKCPRIPNYPFCSKALKWFENAKKYKNNENFEHNSMRARYFNIVNSNIEVEGDSINQISRDVIRTFPKHPQFTDKSIGLSTLTRVLTSYAKYSSQVGYVQGMNFICGSLLYHCKEEAAFWLFVMLMEDYDLEEVYSKGLPGLYKHSIMIENLLSTQKSLEYVYEQLKVHQIKIDMFATDWIFTLFSNIIPIETMGEFYDRFFSESWPFFYKFLFSILKSCKKEILEGEDFGDILSPIRCKNEEGVKDSSLLKKIKSFLWMQPTFWDTCLKDCNNFQFNERQVLKELSMYDTKYSACSL